MCCDGPRSGKVFGARHFAVSVFPTVLIKPVSARLHQRLRSLGIIVINLSRRQTKGNRARRVFVSAELKSS